MAEQTWQPSACILCECNCGIEVQIADRSIAKIRGDRTHPGSLGYVCEKAQRLDRYQSNPRRLTSPLRRREDGSYEEIDWDTAVAEIAAKLTAIRAEHGGEKIFFYGGGGQGNHLGRANAVAFQAALGSKYYSNALAQEKTGEAWVDGRMYGGHTKGDFERSEVVMFIGKNPWMSQSFPRARLVLKAIAADPNRTMIVIDPRRSETAAMADIHLQVKPGTDAWCLAALAAVVVQDDLIDHAFVADHTVGTEPVIEALRSVPVAAYADSCGVPEALIRLAATRFATAESATTYEDLGVQQSPNSTLCSYLQKMLWILTGNFAKPGAMFLHSSFAPLAAFERGAEGKPGRDVIGPALRQLQGVLAGPARMAARELGPLAGAGMTKLPGRAAARLATLIYPVVQSQSAGVVRSAAGGSSARRTPVTGARVLAGLIPANSITDEILTDHPDRFRAIWLDSTNPVHSLAQSDRFVEAMRSLELSVVVDVAMTETARCADYVLPAASQFEKCEATFFNFEFPRNVFHLRRPLFEPLPGTLPEPEIYARLMRQMKVVDPAIIARLRAAAQRGRTHFQLAFFATVGADPQLAKVAAFLTYEALGPTLPAGMRGAAVLWAAAHGCAMTNAESVAAAGFDQRGFAQGEALFDAVMSGRGKVFTSDDYETTWRYSRFKDRKIRVAIPEMLELFAKLPATPPRWTSDEFPFVLSAGERRRYTANTIFRDPSWRKADANGALRISPADADQLDIREGARVRIVTEGGTAEADVEISEMLQPGHISLPNGLGLDFVAADGAREKPGVSPNDLTLLHYKDEFAGTPWHKHVPARVEPLDV